MILYNNALISDTPVFLVSGACGADTISISQHFEHVSCNYALLYGSEKRFHHLFKQGEAVSSALLTRAVYHHAQKVECCSVVAHGWVEIDSRTQTLPPAANACPSNSEPSPPLRNEDRTDQHISTLIL